jgi:formate C-acetyltransferase
MASGANNLAIFNDEAIVASFVDEGFSPEDSRDYIITGCVQPAPRATYGSLCASHIIGPKVLELLLSRNKSYDSFDGLMRDFNEASTNIIRNAISALNKADRAHEALLPNPFVSVMMDGSFERGVDVKSGGAAHNLSGVNLIGIGTLADSLESIKYYDFRRRRLTSAFIAG